MKIIKTAGMTVLVVFGALWWIVESTSFFASPEAAQKIKELWWLFLLVGLAISIYKLWPKKRHSFLIGERDTSIEVVIGDIFKESGPIVVGSNTVYQTDPNVISINSIQGQFTDRHVASPDTMNIEIQNQVQEVPVAHGTTVRVTGNDRFGYFCAIAQITAGGVAQCNRQEFQEALGGLWTYLANNAEKEVINVPILGSGFSRIGAKREVLFGDIILSFIAATSASTFCDGIRIVILPSDIERYKIDVEELVEFVKHHCKYATRLAPNLDQPQGEGEP